jgi:hypothetical protein
MTLPAELLASTRADIAREIRCCRRVLRWYAKNFPTVELNHIDRALELARIAGQMTRKMKGN